MDNYAVFGHDSAEVTRAGRSIAAQLNSQKLPTHEEVGAQEGGTFVGLRFGARPAVVSVKSERIWKLRAAIEGAISQNSLSGSEMDILLGHLVWALTVFRPALSLLDACYAFSREHQASQGRLWPAVIRELDALSTLMPLFRAELGRPWFHRVDASDASPYGLGVCHRSLDPIIVGEIGRTIETWRYQDESSAAARRHALGDDESAGDPDRGEALDLDLDGTPLRSIAEAPAPGDTRSWFLGLSPALSPKCRRRSCRTTTGWSSTAAASRGPKTSCEVKPGHGSGP